MSETETTVPMDDKALFDAATTTEAPATETPAQETKTEQPDAGPARDEHGRFAPKVEAEAPAEAPKAETTAPVVQPPAPQVEANREPPPGWLPAWRVREMVEAAQRKAAPPPEPVDPYVDPQKFRDQGIAEATAPLAQQLASTREHFSRLFAETKHGEQTVRDAYGWLQQAVNNGDPKAGPVLQSAMNSIDPFGEIVTAFKHDRAINVTGGDPQAWFQKQLQEAAKDPAKRQELMTLLSGEQSQQNGATPNAPPTNVVKLPPSLNRQPGTAGNASPGTFDDKDLYANAIR